jgi:hypothetical protein
MKGTFNAATGTSATFSTSGPVHVHLDGTFGSGTVVLQYINERGSYQLVAAQTQANYSGRFAAGSGYAANNVITTNSGATITVNTVSAGKKTVADQTETDFDGVATNGTFVGGVGYAADDEITLSDGSVITVDAIENTNFLKVGQTQLDFDGVGGNGTFVAGDGAGATRYNWNDLITLSDGSVVRVFKTAANGNVLSFRVESAGTSAFSSIATLTQDGVSPTRLIASQTQANYNGVSTNGTFEGGAGYVVGAQINLNDGSLVTVVAVNAGAVTQFAVTSAGATGFEPDDELVQVSTNGVGAGFTLTPGEANSVAIGVSFSLTPGANNRVAKGVVTGFTVTSASTAKFASEATLTQAGTTGAGTGFEIESGTANEAAFGDVATFTITTASTSALEIGQTVAQVSVTPSGGTGFSVVPAAANVASNWKPVTGASYTAASDAFLTSFPYGTQLRLSLSGATNPVINYEVR